MDELLVFVAPKLLGGPRTAVGDLGISSIDGAIDLTFTGVEALGDDILITARPTSGASSTGRE